MMFLTVLAAATGLGLRNAASSLGGRLADRITVQIVEPNKTERDRQAAAAVAQLGKIEGVTSQRRIDEETMEKLVAPWLGSASAREDLPIPALIDVDLALGAQAKIPAIDAALRKVAPAARIDDHGDFLKPLNALLSSLVWLAAVVVFLTGAATSFAVVLAARYALDSHRSAIDVMHLLGATDSQIAKLFQRRIALDALFGGLVGFGAAILVILLLGTRVAALGSDLLGSVSLPTHAWTILFLLPLAGTLLAMGVARLTVLRTLGRSL
jgi:cell division transport system permease protein